MQCRLCSRTVGCRQAKEQTRTKLRHRTKTTDTCLSIDLLFFRPDLGTGWHVSDSHQTRYGFPHVFNGGGILRDVRWFLQTLSGRLRRMWVTWALGTGEGLESEWAPLTQLVGLLATRGQSLRRRLLNRLVARGRPMGQRSCPKDEDRPKPIRAEIGEADRQTPKARQRSCRSIN